MKIVVCCSGGGSNFESILQSQLRYGSYEVCLLLVDRDCGAVSIASTYGISNKKIDLSISDGWFHFLRESSGYDLVVLAGFMPILPEYVISQLSGAVINTHPSLLPRHGGLGMYGVKVQESVLASGDKFAGCTVHMVTPEIDSGGILGQVNIRIPNKISAWELGGLVHQEEKLLLPYVINEIASGRIVLDL
jgi:phosphoribosylglycinamide formyltransferase-1